MKQESKLEEGVKREDNSRVPKDLFQGIDLFPLCGMISSPIRALKSSIQRNSPYYRTELSLRLLAFGAVTIYNIAFTIGSSIVYSSITN